MTGVTDMMKMVGLAKSVMPVLNYLTTAPKPLLEDDPKEFDKELKGGKKIFLLQTNFAFESDEKRKEFLKHDEMFQDLLSTLKDFAEKQNKK